MLNDNKYPLLSLITVTLNAERFLEGLIQDVAIQDRSNVEWIVVDGGSQDRTVSIIQSNRVHIDNWISEPDFGFYDALNKAIKLARGKYYLVVGADDRLENDCFKKIMDLLTEYNDELDLIIFSVIRSGKVLRPKKYNWIRGAIGWSSYITSHSVGSVVRKDLHQSLGYYSSKFPLLADGHFLSKIFCRPHKVRGCNVVLGTFVEGGMTSNSDAQIAAETWLIQILLGRSLFMQTLFFIIRVIKLKTKKCTILVNTLQKIWFDNAKS